MAVSSVTSPAAHPLDASLHPAGRWAFATLLVGGLLFADWSILLDTGAVAYSIVTLLPADLVLLSRR